MRNEFPLASAKRVAHIAVQADEAGQHDDALRIYTSAIELYMKAMRTEPDPVEAASHRSIVGNLLARAEQLKRIPQ